jgi:hypothetical protein
MFWGIFCLKEWVRMNIFNHVIFPVKIQISKPIDVPYIRVCAWFKDDKHVIWMWIVSEWVIVVSVILDDNKLFNISCCMTISNHWHNNHSLTYLGWCGCLPYLSSRYGFIWSDSRITDTTITHSHTLAGVAVFLIFPHDTASSGLTPESRQSMWVSDCCVSDSGARPDEAVSWGKIKKTATPAKVCEWVIVVSVILESDQMKPYRGER